MGKMKHKIDKVDKNQRFAEPLITIELEAPEEIPEENTPDLNIQPQK